jgi:BlaI family penicillinase repressor
MPRKPSTQLNDVELSILRVLWTLGSATVRQVHAALHPGRPAASTGTLKMMQVMCGKGLLARDDAVRPHVYRPAVPAEQTQARLVGDLVDRVFGGSTKRLVLRAVQAGDVSADELAEIRKLLKKAEKRQREKP